MKIAIAGAGYVGLSNAVLLVQANELLALDIAREKVEMLNRMESPIEDAEIEDFLKNQSINFRAARDKESAYRATHDLNARQIIDGVCLPDSRNCRVQHKSATWSRTSTIGPVPPSRRV